MKRKLLSLTLVLALVLSLVPMGAFADASRLTSVFSPDKTSYTADNKDYVEFTINAYDNNNDKVTNQWIYVASSRADADVFATESAFSPVYNSPSSTGGVFVKTDGNGKASVFMRTGVAGTSKIGAFIASNSAVDENNEADAANIIGTSSTRANAFNYLNGNTTSKNVSELGLIKTVDITSSGSSANSIELVSRVKKIGGNTDTTTGVNENLPKANGIDYYEYTFKVRTGAYVQANSTTQALASGAPVSGQVVKFYSPSTNVTFDKTEATTDGAGEVKVKAYANKANVTTGYDIEARAGNVAVETKNNGLKSYNYVDYKAKYSVAGITGITLSSSQDQKIALDDQIKTDVALYDGSGNKIDFSGSGNGEKVTFGGTTVTWENTVYPSGGEVKKTDIQYKAKSNGDLRFVMGNAKLIKEGKYTFRVYLDNGKKVDLNFTVVKQGTITKLDYYYDEGTTVTLNGGTASTMTLDRLDASDVVKSADSNEIRNDFYFTSSDSSLITVDRDGVVKCVTDEREDIGKEVTITAADRVNKINKSVTFKIGGALAGVKADAPATAKVGSSAAVTISFVDTKGNVVAPNSLKDSEGNFISTSDIQAVVLEKPADSSVGVEKATNFESKVNETGTGIVNITSSKAGKVVVQIVAEYDRDGNASTYSTVRYSALATINFGAADVVASKTLVLNMGSTTGFMNNGAVKSDLAPFIKDGRAFVPVSFIASQLGGTAEFTKNAAGLVDTVTVKAGTTTVTMTIGSTTIKVVKDGKESTVTSDVAPFIKSGRTVLPFRAIAEAMGAKVSFGPETGAVEWVKFEM